MTNENLSIGAIGGTVGIITHSLGVDIILTLFIAFGSGFVSVAGKHFFNYLKNDKNEK
jgi:hypothetical protein